MIFATRKKLLLAGAACGLLLAGAALVYCFVSPAEPEEFRPGPRHMFPFDPLTEFPVRPVAEAAKGVNPTELVLGVTIGKESRAYPINMLNTFPGQKLVNDTLGGKAIAATW
jgi:hypothetical protein